MSRADDLRSWVDLGILLGVLPEDEVIDKDIRLVNQTNTWWQNWRPFLSFLVVVTVIIVGVIAVQILRRSKMNKKMKALPSLDPGCGEKGMSRVTATSVTSDSGKLTYLSDQLQGLVRTGRFKVPKSTVWI